MTTDESPIPRSLIDPLPNARASTRCWPVEVLGSGAAARARREQARLEAAFGRELAPDSVRVAWSRGGRLRAIEAPAGHAEAMVVGRHDRCDIVLGGDRSVGNRHLLLVPGTGGDVELIALGEVRRFHHLDGWPQVYQRARGPHTVVVGEHVMTVWPPAGEPTPVPEPAADLRVRIRLLGADELVQRVIHASHLVRGVLVGRAPRGGAETAMSRACDSSVSRAHALVRVEGPDVVVHDLCSTYGTWRGDRRVRRAVVPSDGAAFHLGPPDDGVLLTVDRS